MYITSEQPQNKFMAMSMALNVALAFGIVALLTHGSAATPSPCAGIPLAVSDTDIAHAGKIRIAAPIEAAQPTQVMREAASHGATGNASQTVTYIRCQPS
jgi:hypothetical protein